MASAPAAQAAASRFRGEELKQLERAVAGGVWRGVLVAQGVMLVALFLVATLAGYLSTASAGLSDTFSDISSQLR